MDVDKPIFDNGIRPLRLAQKAPMIETSVMGVPSYEYRCQSCQKLLCKGFLVEGELEVKCKHCHEVTKLNAKKTNELLCLIANCPGRIAFNSKKPAA